MINLIELNGAAGVDDGYYDGSTVERARKPIYVPNLREQKTGVDMNAAKLNTRENK